MKKKRDEYFFEYPDFNNVKEIVYDSVNKYPDNTAFILKNKVNNEVTYTNKTFKNFLEDVNNLGAGLYNLGLQNKRVAVISKNRYEWAVSFTSILLGNMVAVPLDKGLTEIEIENSIKRTNPEAIIFDNGMEEVISKIKDKKDIKIKEYICMEENEKYNSIKRISEIGRELRLAGNKEFENAEIDSEKTSELM